MDMADQTWVNLSRFLDSRLRCTSAMSLSRQTDRWACRSRGCAATIRSRSAVYIYVPQTYVSPLSGNECDACKNANHLYAKFRRV